MWFRCEVFKGRRPFLLISLQRGCVYFFLGLPVRQPPGVPGPSKLGWRESERSFCELNFGRRRVNVFSKDAKSPCSLSVPLCKSLCNIESSKSALTFSFFYFRALVIARVIIYTLY